MPDASQLEDQIVAALRRAVAEERAKVAEHLLRALETLCPEVPPGSPMADAYFVVAGEAASRRLPD